MSLALIVPIHGELPEKRYRHRIGAVALLRLGKKCSFDLRRAEGDIADDPTGIDIGNDIHARDAAHVVAPSVTAEPSVEGVAATVEMSWIVALDQGTRRRDRRHVSAPRTGRVARVRPMERWFRRGDRSRLRTPPNP